LDFAEARYYNNNHGRFTAVDPLLASGKSTNPQTFNRYAYTMNRPLILTDETGLQTGKKTKGKEPAKTETQKTSTPSGAKVISVKVLPSGISSDDGCKPNEAGIKVAITYQVIDEKGKDIKSNNMTPQEKITDVRINTPELDKKNQEGQGVDQKEPTNIGPSRNSATSENTNKNGQFVDAPFGVCNSDDSPFTYKFKQEITVKRGNETYKLRVNEVTVTSTGINQGEIVNNSGDIRAKRPEQ
jgi:hypothetical protein